MGWWHSQDMESLIKFHGSSHHQSASYWWREKNLQVALECDLKEFWRDVLEVFLCQYIQPEWKNIARDKLHYIKM